MTDTSCGSRHLVLLGGVEEVALSLIADNHLPVSAPSALPSLASCVTLQHHLDPLAPSESCRRPHLLCPMIGYQSPRATSESYAARLSR